MKVIALTGGAASGKGAASGYLGKVALELGLKVDQFDCDAAVASLWNEDGILEELRKKGGGDVFTDEGELDKSALRDKLFADRNFRSMIEEVLHPLVLERARQFASNRSRAVDVLLFEVPLLYEVDFPLDRDFTVVVGASVGTQCQRMIEIRGLTADAAAKVMASQLPTGVKVRNGDFVIWNDGSMDSLKSQVESLALRIF